MEGDTPHWTDWINFDAGFDAQPWGSNEIQGDLAAQGRNFVRRDPWLQNGLPIAAPPDLSSGSQPFDQTWPLNDSVVPTHPFTECLSPSMFNFQDVNGQQHVQQSSLSESAIYAEPVPQAYVNHGSLSKGGILKDTAGRQQPMVESFLACCEGEDDNLDQPHLDPIHKCSCMTCLFLGTNRDDMPNEYELDKDRPYIQETLMVCRFPGCQEQTTGLWTNIMRFNGAKHERTHFGKAGDYHCLEEGCKTITKKFADLKRHYLVRHCTNATKFPCPFLGCKYGGDNGFTREDKLKSHRRNVHKGNVVPGNAFQTIKPKATEAKVIEGKPQGIQTIKPKPSAGA